MKVVKWISGGVLATIGLGFSLLCFVVAIVEPPADPESSSDRADLIAAGLFFLPPGLLGGFLLWSAYRQTQREYQDKLWNAFYELIQTQDGHVSALSYAMHAKVTGEVARQFLDARSQEFNGHFRVSTEGDISYWFNPRIGQDQSQPQLDEVSDLLPLDTLPPESSSTTLHPEQEP